MPKASPSECAASVDSTSVRCPARAASVAVPAAAVVLPTPPLPVKRRIRTTVTPRSASDSTRFLRPFSAVSMMTFSPLRLSMPIIGMVTSTASR